MATKKTTKVANKAIFIVKKYPYNHPDEDELVPVGGEVDLSHLTIADRALLVNRGVMEPTHEGALTIPEPERKPEPPRLNKYGLPFGQRPKDRPDKEKLANG